MTESENASPARGNSGRAWKVSGIAVMSIAGIGLAVVFGIVAQSAIVRNWDAGEPWFTGFQIAPFATPLTAIVAAAVAITTAKWGLESARETRDKDHARWEADRTVEQDRRRVERRDATERNLRDRFHELVRLLASEELRARGGAAYAVVALADDWNAHYSPEDEAKARAEQQVCINLLIAQLRDPITDEMDAGQRAQLQAFKQGVQKLISSRLGGTVDGESEPGLWSDFEFVFDGCWFYNLDMAQCVMTGETCSFSGAQFDGEWTSFVGAVLGSKVITFRAANFRSNHSIFSRARFRGRSLSFQGAQFDAKRTTFVSTEFESDYIQFGQSSFCGVTSFDSATFGGQLLFHHAAFTGRRTSFANACFQGPSASFSRAHFDADRTSFEGAKFESPELRLHSTHFVGRALDLDHVQATSGRVRVASVRLFCSSVTAVNARVSGLSLEANVTSLPRSAFPCLDGEIDESAVRFEVDESTLRSCARC